MTKDNGRFFATFRKASKNYWESSDCYTATGSFTSLSGTLVMQGENEWFSLTVGVFCFDSMNSGYQKVC